MRNSPISVIAATTLLSFAATAAGANPVAAPAVVSTPFTEQGYTITTKATAQDCLVASNIDLETMIAKTADLQRHGMVRKNVDAAHVRAHAWTIASAMGLKLQPQLIQDTFKGHPEIERCGFLQTITAADNALVSAYALVMTRAQYDKINWSTFTGQQLPATAEHFSVGPVTQQHVDAEAKVP
ncbi:hypothetical protein LT85_2403 [Collimonas arenae]|uniref:Uncharacterized protein n=1 Tax=Collimonas arenae TaxID=279058 RepID=A0A0A1FAI1_9BURK|nr:hypothetical protein [Collimonas arenae]AIY41561.1 hypothetical protein LT85_2403 [Collimonas arenae]